MVLAQRLFAVESFGPPGARVDAGYAQIGGDIVDGLHRGVRPTAKDCLGSARSKSTVLRRRKLAEMFIAQEAKFEGHKKRRARRHPRKNKRRLK